MKMSNNSLGSGIFYTAISKYSGVLISIIIGAILARLLTPQDFGIVALVTVFVSFFNLLSDFGLGPGIIQNQSLDNEDIYSIFSFSIILGITFSGMFFFASPYIAEFYNEKDLLNVSRFLSLAILFHSIQIIPKALVRKDLKFKQIGLINVGVQFFCGIITILLALKGFRYYALVIQSILVGLISLIVFYYLKPIKVIWAIQLRSIKKIMRFSFFQFMFNFINYFSRNSDNILIGKFLGSSPLGYYDKAYRLMLMPIQNLTHVFTPVLMPVMAKYQYDTTYVFNSYLKIIKILATLGFPLSVFLFFAASDIINVVYGPQWNESIPVFKLLSLTIGIQIVLSSTGAIFQTVNRTDLLFVSGFLSSLLMIGGISYGIFWGKSLISVGHGLIFAFCLNFLQTFYLLFVKTLSKSFFSIFQILKIPLIISVCVSISMYFFDFLSLSNIYISLISKSSIAFLAFLIGFLPFSENRILAKNLLKTRL